MVVNAKTSNHDIALDVITITSGLIKNWRIERDLAHKVLWILSSLFVVIEIQISRVFSSSEKK
jgi:hypothetical protein